MTSRLADDRVPKRINRLSTPAALLDLVDIVSGRLDCILLPRLDGPVYAVEMREGLQFLRGHFEGAQ